MAPTMRLQLICSYGFLLVAILTGCDNSSKSTAVAPETQEGLAAFARANLPQGNWSVKGIGTDGEGRLAIEVAIPEEDVTFVRARPRIQQVKLIEVMCPPPDAPVWKGVPKDKTVWVGLSSPKGPVTGASCRH